MALIRPIDLFLCAAYPITSGFRGQSKGLSCLNIKAMEFSGNELSLLATPPPWRPKIPEGLRLTAQIEHPGREISKVTGGKRINGVDGKSIISLEPGTVEVHFR